MERWLLHEAPKWQDLFQSGESSPGYNHIPAPPSKFFLARTGSNGGGSRAHYRFYILAKKFLTWNVSAC